jgi:hypothetical protein
MSKKFSSKKGQHFYLLHRSSTDEQHGTTEGQASNYVLVKAGDVMLL